MNSSLTKTIVLSALNKFLNMPPMNILTRVAIAFAMMMASSTMAFTVNKYDASRMMFPSQRQRTAITLKSSSSDSFSQDANADVPSSLSASTPGIDLAWRSVPKPLLRIGGKGVSATHARSLAELLDAHTCVKIKINTSKLGSLEEAFGCIRNIVEDETSSSGIELIHVRKSDNMIMVGKSGALEMIRAGEFPPPPPPDKDEDSDHDDE